LPSRRRRAGQIAPFLLFMNFYHGHGYGKALARLIRERELRFGFSSLGMD